MKSDQSMGTLMTVFSGVASLMCLLVGLQLFVLKSQIGQATVSGSSDAGHQFKQWEALAHTGAIMSLGAGALIFLFGLRHVTATGQKRKNQSPDEFPVIPAVDLESVSVRVFEVDAADRTVEITHGEDDPIGQEPQGRDTFTSIPGNQMSDRKLTVDPDPERGKDTETDPAETIVRSIRDAASTHEGLHTFSRTAGFFRLPFFGRFFRSKRRG